LAKKKELLNLEHHKTLHRRQTIKQREPHHKPGVISDPQEGLAVAALLVAPVLLLANEKNITPFLI
jgi:hypothetical protein